MRLPVELEFLIIDHFEGDTLQLREFCHVNRAWASHAQSLLFRAIYVRDKNFQRFLTVLQTRTNLGRHITTLNITEGSRGHSGFVLHVIKPILAERMPNVHTLDISYGYFGRMSVEPVGGWTSISRLQLRFCQFATTDALVAFVASFARLESLDVFQCHTPDVIANVKAARLRSAIPMPVWHLKYLALGEFPQNALIDWMVAEPAELVVDHFRILSLGPDASAFNALLEKIGTGLRHLELPALQQRPGGHMRFFYVGCQC